MAEHDDLPLVGMEFWYETAWRMWYAGMALAAIDVPGSTAKQIADLAFELADAMIERGKK